MKNKVIMILREKKKLGIMREAIMLMSGTLDLQFVLEMQNLVQISRQKHK